MNKPHTPTQTPKPKFDLLGSLGPPDTTNPLAGESPPTTADEARRLLGGGLSVIPIKADGSKAAAVAWKPFQSSRPAITDLAKWFIDTNVGIAVVAGEISGNLEIIDFDDSASFDTWKKRVEAADGGKELLKSLPMVLTPSGGRHVFYRCTDGIEGNQKLAQKKVDGKQQVLIETRGKGGYVLLPESPVECHESQQPYVLWNGDLSQIPDISGKQRSLLLDTARGLNENVHSLPSSSIVCDPKAKGGKPAPSGRSASNRPGDDFNAKATWEEVLQPHGWKKVDIIGGEGKEGEEATVKWQRPGKKGVGASATTNHDGKDSFYVFSSNGGPFKERKPYDKFQAFACLNHDDDWSAAAAYLRAQGYGTDDYATADYGTAPWTAPEELPRFMPEVPTLNPDLLPAPLRGWLVDEAERMQVPLEMVAIPALVGLSAVVGRQIGIHPKKHDDWLVIPNLWGTVIARSGTLKSPAQQRGLKPVEKLVSAATDEYEQALAATMAEQQVFKLKIQVVEGEIRTALKEGVETIVDALQKKLTVLNGEKSSRMPKERRYKTNDPTVEKLGEILRQNPNGMMLIRDELSGWFRSLDKFGREGDREFYLESWDGKESYTVDRVERGKIHIPALCVSIIGGIQPGKLEKYVHEALKQGWGDDGMLQRFQLGVYPEISKDWENVDRPPNIKAFKEAMDIFQSLNRLKKLSLLGEIRALHFDSDAQEVFDAFLERIEKWIRSDEIGCASLESHLSKYRSLMPALALIFHLSAEGGAGKAVDLDSTMKAKNFCDFLEKHAFKIYAGAIRPDLQAAHALAQKIKAGKVEGGASVREIYRHHWSFLDAPDLVRAALEILEECGWLKAELVDTNGRSTEIVTLNPELIK